MTSKEALERIKDDIEIGYLSTKHDNEKDKYNYLILLKNIEKDLEILEILKKHIQINEYNYQDEDQKCIDILMPESDENYNIIKEWLEK